MDTTELLIEQTLLPLLGALLLFANEMGAIFTLSYLAFSLRMIIDILKRYANDSSKMILYLIVSVVIPLGSIIYYLVAVPPAQRFVKKGLLKHKKALITVYSIFILLSLLNAVSLYFFLSSQS